MKHITLLALLAASANWSVTEKFQVGGEGGWDYLTVDSQTHRLYVPRSTHTLVLDSATGKTVADIPGQKIAHGVALVPQLNRGFISDGGGEGSIVIFDLKTNAILGTLGAQPDADGIIYDPSSNRIVVVSGDKGTLMSFKPDIDPKSGKMDSPVSLGGAPEFLASDGAGKIYVNLMDKNEVAVFDMQSRRVTARWPVAPGGAPVGMAIDTKNHRLFLGCRKPQKLIVMNTDTGKVIADLPIGDHVDAIKIDGNEIFASCADGTLAVARETSPNKFEIVQTVSTPAGARTMGIDTSTHKIYLPTTATPKSPRTFMIVEVSKR